MAQLTIYLPDHLEKKLRQQAKRAKKSVSAFVADVASRALQPEELPPSFWRLAGSWEGAFPSLDDLPLDDVDL